MIRFYSNLLLAGWLATAVVSTASATVIMEVVPAYGPNAISSASWPGYVDNAIASLMGQVVPDRTSDPAGYEAITAMFIDPKEMIVTSFDSGRGEAYAAAPFDYRGGNRVHFGLRVFGTNGMRVALNRLSYTLEWLDKDTGLLSTSSVVNDPFTQGTFLSRDYDGNFVGVIYDNGIDPSGGVTLLENGESGTTLVDEIYYVGIGDALAVTLDVAPMGPSQSDIDALLTAFLDPNLTPPQQLLVTYQYQPPMVNPVVASGSVMFVPEPAGLAMGAGMAFALLVGGRRRRRA